MTVSSQAIIVGGGPAGASVAINLAKAGVSVFVVPGQRGPSYLPGETLTPQVRIEMENLKLEKLFQKGGAIPSYGIEAAWGHPTPAFHSSMLDPLGEGSHVDRYEFHELLLNAAHQAGAYVLREGRFSTARPTTAGWNVVVHSSSGIQGHTCKVLIDATGRSARVARSLGAQKDRFDTLCGISAVIEAPVPDQALLVEATPFGWWYLAPLPKFRTLVCFISDTDIILQLGAHRSNVWLDLLKHTTSISSRLRKLPVSVQIQTHPCETAMLNPVAGDAWLAVGDAASVFDPISSMGVLKALQSGRDAACAVAEYLKGDNSAFGRYSERRLDEFHAYLANKHRHYALEARWQTDIFWARRITTTQGISV